MFRKLLTSDEDSEEEQEQKQESEQEEEPTKEGEERASKLVSKKKKKHDEPKKGKRYSEWFMKLRVSTRENTLTSDRNIFLIKKISC